MLGMDFLSQHEASVSTKDGRITIGWFPLNSHLEGDATFLATVEFSNGPESNEINGLNTNQEICEASMIEAGDLVEDIGLLERNEEVELTKPVQDLKEEFPKVFQGLGHCGIVKHAIHTGTSVPTSVPNHRNANTPDE
jgi:hypothetical protein